MGLTTAKLTRVLIYGEDDEDTETLRLRYQESFNERAFAGNAKDYHDKTLGIAGVGAVKVIRAWNGPGTVKLVILDSVFGKATDVLVQTVQKEFDPNKDGHGDGLAPIGHAVTVDTASEVTVNIAATITYDNGYDLNTCKTQIETAIEEYFAGLRKNWENQSKLVVRIASIDAAIMGVKGVVDVTGTTLNGGGNVELTEYEIRYWGWLLMADRYINLKELLPLYLQAYKELAAPMDAETPEFRAIETEHNRIIANRYIVTCDEEGIVRYEKLMGIQPKADDTLKDRIFRCITKWNVCLPYNYAFLNQKLKELCGAEYTLDLDIAGQTVTVKVGLAQKNQYDVVAEMLEEIVPCNLQLNLSLLYNQYRTLKPYPHIILAQFTHWELRNLSIPRNLSAAVENIAAYTVMIWHASQWKRLRI